MVRLDNHGIIRIWEIGQNQHPIDRAITVIQEADPGREWDDIVSSCVGERNSQLLAIRELTFGSEMHGIARCSFCEKELEFVADVAEIRADCGRGSAVYTRVFDGYEVSFRLVNSRDLSMMASASPAPLDATPLLRRCILQSFCDGIDVSNELVPESVINSVGIEMARLDPQAVMAIHVDCAECGRALSIPIDIVTFLWREIDAQARRLLREVHTLARCYGWHERDILELSAARRFFYMELVAT